MRTHKHIEVWLAKNEEWNALVTLKVSKDVGEETAKELAEELRLTVRDKLGWDDGETKMILMLEGESTGEVD